MPHDTKSEAEWKAEMDANTLAEADVIKNDPKRLKAAAKAAKKLIADAEAKAKGFKVIENIN